MEVRDILGYVPFALVLLLAYLSFLVVRPFILTILGAFLIAYIFSPLYHRLERRTGRKNVSAFLVILLIFVLLTAPVVFVLSSVASEANLTYLHAKAFLETGAFPEQDCAEKVSVTCSAIERINVFLVNPDFQYYFREMLRRVTTFFTNNAERMIVSIPSAVIDFFLMLFIVFFSLRDGKSFFQKLDSIIPLDKKDRNQIFSSIKNMTYGVIYGSILVALLQGLLGGLGFALFGIPSPVLWGVIMGILAFIPMVGPMLVWLPAALFFILDALAAGSSWGIAKGILLIVYGLIFISSVESIVKPIIIGGRAKTHPLIIIVGVLGGIHTFGILGLFLGPLILELLITFIGIIRYHWKKD